MINDAEILRQTIIVFAILFGGATLLTLLFRGTGWGRNMTLAILMWAVIAFAFLFCSYGGWKPFAVLMILIAYGAVREFYVMNEVYSVPALMIAAVFIVLMGLAAAAGHLRLFYALPVLSAFALFPAHAARHSFDDINRTVSLHVTGLVYWGCLPLHFLLLQRIEGGFGVIVLLCTMIALNDNGAFYFGKLLGKNSPKLAPQISPNKTWVGFAGGFLVTVTVAASCQFMVPHLDLATRLALGVLTAVAVPAGGLIESAMKRSVGVKDSGFLIPGHGGVMDRFDSWTFTSPLVYYFLTVVVPWWKG